VACYCGLTIPVVGVGIVAGFVGYFPAVLCCRSWWPSCASAPSPASPGPHLGHGGGEPVTSQPSPTGYQIRIRGHLGATMLRAFPALHAETRGRDTLLRGALPDQAALHSVLAQVEALGLELLEVRRLPRARI
jgi:hypothetical protein